MDNPWQVQSIEDFACLKCPECVFFCKEEHFFRDHALENHPKSFELFWEEFEEETKTNHMFNDKKIDKENLNVKISKGQTKSKRFFQADVPSKTRTNEFDFTTMIPQVDLFSFVFWKKLKTPKRHFEIN